MLSAVQMAQMSRLLDEALELDPKGRRRWLEGLPAEYRELESALRRALLPEGDGASGSAEPVTLPKVGADTSAIGSGLQPGERVGPYLLVRPLGAGGMAEVWLAQRADGAFKREVALKLPMLSQLRKDLASRFSRERDILAALEHPNIARLYDAGISAEGLPYLAMEYVHGEPLIHWCNGQRLGIRERLKLFLQVLDAVQYAHEQHVIHRDIKPSNILVSDSGQVRLLDFGVAKLLVEEGQTELTQMYGQALTPEYASPELVRGEPIDAAADVYSLGVVLYELLSGSRPYRIKAGASVALLEQAIATAQVERPSTQVGPEAGADRSTTQDKLARRLRGDLDAIVLKALAKAPADRYASASALAHDLQRYLSGDPVEARPASPAYLIGKFVQRHRTGVATSAAVTVLVVVVIGYELTRSPALEHSVAEKAAAPTPNTATATVSDKSIAVLPFVNMSADKEQEYFSDGLTEELIDRLSHSPDLKVIARTSAFQFKGRNEDVRSIAGKLGVANLLEGSVRKAGNELRITAQLIRADNGTHVWSQTYERNLSDIFKVQDDIAGTVAGALNVALRSGGSSGAERRMPSKEAYNQVLLGNYFSNRGTDQDDRRAVAAYTQATKIDPNYALAWAKLAWATDEDTAEGRAKAADFLQKSLTLDPNLAYTHIELGRILFRKWDWSGAKSEFERAIELDPNDLLARGWFAWLTEGILGRFDRNIGYLRQIVSNDPLDPEPLSYLAVDLEYAGQLDSAAATYQRLLEMLPAAGWYHEAYAETILLADRPAEALAALQKETEEKPRQKGKALVYWKLGKKTESDAALARLEKVTGSGPGLILVAEVHAYRGETDAAFEWLERAYRLRDPWMGDIEIKPLLHSLHGDPRFDAMLHKLKLDDWKRQVSASWVQSGAEK